MQENTIIDLLVEKIKNGKMTIEDVPDGFKEQVQAKLDI